MRKLICAVAVATASMGLGGCATVMNGTSQPVEFRSDPVGAEIALATGLKCETPCEYSMKRGHDAIVTFSKDGYKSEKIYIQSRLGGSVMGNILAGGIIGGIVDGSNGASNHLYPDPVSIRLVAVDSSEAAVLLDKDGKVISTVAEYNSKVEADVKKGLEERGLNAEGKQALTITESE